MGARLTLDRDRILSFRRRVGALDERIPPGPASLRRAAWAGLQDSVPRAAVLAIHARVDDTGPTAWEDPSLAQLWGPRFSVFVVAASDHPVFALGTLPDDDRRRRRAHDLAGRLDALLDGARMPYAEAGRALGIQPNSLRYAAATGRVLIRWDGARRPDVWTVPAPDLDPREARLELVRRYLHVSGPATTEAVAWWVGIAPRSGRDAITALGRAVIPVRTPLDDAWILAEDEAAFGTDPSTPAAARFLSSGDPYLMAGDRELLVPDLARRRELWPPSTVWPGGLLVRGELVGSWRRAGARMTIRPWRRLSSSVRGDVEAEAGTLPIPDLHGPIDVTWAG